MSNHKHFLPKIFLLAVTACILSLSAQAHENKKDTLPVDRVKHGLSVMVLGSGGPVATNKRVSAGYLIFTCSHC